MLKSRSTAHDPLAVPAYVYPYTAGLIGGLIGGIAMTVPAIIFGVVSGVGIWYPVNLVAATLLRRMQGMTAEEIARFDLVALVVGLVIHLTLSTLLGLVFAMLLPTLPGRPVAWAVLIGPFLWFVATLAILPQINPLMSRLLDWPSFGTANVVYGLVMGLWVGRTPKVSASAAHHLR